MAEQGLSPDQMDGSAPESAIPAGETVRTTIERGDAYLSPQIYNVDITVQEIVRGAEAAERVKTQGMIDTPPVEGSEYALIRITMKYSRRIRGMDDENYTLQEGQFVAVSADGGQEYDVPAVLKQPEPGLIGKTFDPGDSHEGWILLQVPVGEKQPKLIYKRKHVEGVYGIWGYLWLQLY